MKVVPCWLGLVAAAVVHGQGPLTGPNSGLTFDEHTRSIRWIVGVPGAAYLGPAIAEDLDLACVSPDSRIAVAVKDGVLVRARLDAAPVRWEVLDKAARAIVWSADSEAAVVLDDRVALWRNLGGGAPEKVTLAGVEGAEWSSFVVEPGAEAVFAAGQSGVYRLAAAEARLLAATEGAAAIALDGRHGTLFVAERGHGSVIAVRNWSAGPEVSTFTSAVDDPVAVALSRDGSSLLVASASTRRLAQFDVETAAPTQAWQLDFTPARLDPIATGLLSLNARATAAEPLQVLADGAIWFIPAR